MLGANFKTKELMSIPGFRRRRGREVTSAAAKTAIGLPFRLAPRRRLAPPALFASVAVINLLLLRRHHGLVVAAQVGLKVKFETGSTHVRFKC